MGDMRKWTLSQENRLLLHILRKAIQYKFIFIIYTFKPVYLSQQSWVSKRLYIFVSCCQQVCSRSSVNMLGFTKSKSKLTRKLPPTLCCSGFQITVFVLKRKLTVIGCGSDEDTSSVPQGTKQLPSCLDPTQVRSWLLQTPVIPHQLQQTDLLLYNDVTGW